MRAFAGLAVVPVLIALGACKGPQVPAQRTQFKLITPSHVSFSDQATYQSTLESIRNVALAAEIDGRIIAMPMQEGQRVQSGDALFTLDQVQQQAQVNASAAAARKDRVNAERYIFLNELGAVSTKDRDFYVTKAVESADLQHGQHVKEPQAKGYVEVDEVGEADNGPVDIGVDSWKIAADANGIGQVARYRWKSRREVGDDVPHNHEKRNGEANPKSGFAHKAGPVGTGWRFDELARSYRLLLHQKARYEERAELHRLRALDEAVTAREMAPTQDVREDESARDPLVAKRMEAGGEPIPMDTLRAMTVRAEILAGAESPAEDRELRLKIQVEEMNVGKIGRAHV